MRRGREDPAQLALAMSGAPTNADELLARLRALGLRRIDRCTLTKNRSVMISCAGGEMRVHRGYLLAPDDVLHAIVRFVEGRTRAERSSARRQLLAFPIERPVTPRRREQTHPADEALARRLTAAHAEMNHERFAGSLRTLEVRVSRRMRARLGHYTAATPARDPAEIAISRRHVRRDGWEQALDTLLHEMIHQWQDEHGHAIDHGRVFRAKARELGVSPFARRRVAA